MKIAKFFLSSLSLALFLSPVLSSQVSKTSQAYKGWPSEADYQDIRTSFVQPPKGYGNVPFYWWSGDPLDMDRLKEQLDILADASTDGLNISYNHTHAEVDTLINAMGHGSCGRVSGGEPRIFSPEWRKIWNEYSKLCAEKGIGLGLDDYVVAWPGNGEYIDDILKSSEFSNYPGRLKMKRIGLSDVKPESTLSVVGVGDSLDVVYVTAAPDLHPEYGHRLVSDYFQPFEDNMDAGGREGMNYFFQDELMYDLTLTSWCEDMPRIFKEKKGYDIIPYLPLLFIKKDSEIDATAAKVRMDYAEVLVDLSEERYFKPIFDWSNERGLIYGCDNLGRGLDPTQYVDYFRSISWFTAPGNDAPARGSSFRQTKVSSSISHLYDRPRTWLEAFHSMGWDANGGVLTYQLDHHMIAGGNLLCMHGLYYSTHGGWWEWAPPCFHFRMPYWPHMKHWLKYAERMSYVLSQGSHVCDIAILYPTETMQAYPEATPDLMFKVSLMLSNHGLDYDFIDYSSLKKASVSNASISISDEQYRVLVLPDTRAMHTETLAKVAEFARQGGIIITVGGTMDGVAPSLEYSAEDFSAMVPDIRSRITPDFVTASGKGKVLHRRVGSADVYMVMDVEKGDEMTFRSEGKVELWDAMHGSIKAASVLSCGNGLTTLRFDGEKGNSRLLVFSPGEPVTAAVTENSSLEMVKEISVNGAWDVEVIPTMNNKWGDFRLPAFDGYIGVEAREIACTANSAASLSVTDSKEIYGYGPYMRSFDLAPDQSLAAFLDTDFDTKDWSPYVFSWQYGVPDSPGSQGYHGLKAKVDEKFLILDRGCHQIFATDLNVPADGLYVVMQKGVRPFRIMIDGKTVTSDRLELSKGWHKLIVAYADTKKTEYSLRGMYCFSVDKRDRSMVMLYPEASSGPQEHDMFDSIVASSWYGTDFVPFCVKDADKWNYSFETAPGTVSMRFEVKGSIDRIWIDGKAVGKKYIAREIVPGRTVYKLEGFKSRSTVSEVRLLAHPDVDCPGASFFAEPVKMECRGGMMEAGDWTEEGAMRFFSGGVRYSKTVSLSELDGKITLDLGEVDATCEVSVNGKPVDILLSKPYELDVTEYLHSGDNKIEVLVYSSLSNHYQTIPSPYQGTPHAGLIGPVRLLVK